MAWSDVNNSVRNNITNLLELRERRRARGANNLMSGAGAIFDAISQMRKEKEAAVAASQQNAWDVSAAGQGNEWSKEADTLAHQRALELASLNNAAAMSRTLVGKDEEETAYPTSDAWIMYKWQEFASLTGLTDPMGNAVREPSNEDYKAFRSFIETTMDEEKYPYEERQMAMDNLARYLSGKYHISPGGGDSDKKGGNWWESLGYASGQEAVPPTYTQEENPLTHPSGETTINGVRVPGLEDFEQPEDFVPPDVTGEEESAYRKLMETIEQYGTSADLRWYKNAMEKPGKPINWENFLKQLEIAIENRKNAHQPLPLDSPLLGGF